MKEELLADLVESIKHAGRIRRDAKRAARQSVIGAPDVQNIRGSLGLSQKQFALLIGVSPRTVQNWEQKRRGVIGGQSHIFTYFSVGRLLLGFGIVVCRAKGFSLTEAPRHKGVFRKRRRRSVTLQRSHGDFGAGASQEVGKIIFLEGMWLHFETISRVVAGWHPLWSKAVPASAIG